MRLRNLVMAGLAVLLLGNMVLVLDALTLGWLTPRAVAESEPKKKAAAEETTGKEKGERGEAAEPEAKPAPDLPVVTPTEGSRAYQALVDQLTAQKTLLEKKAADLAERERQFQVLRQELTARQPDAPAAPSPTAPAAAGGKPEPTVFTKLLKAYEGMDPANAASALAELAGRDRKVVVDILLGMKARQAAALLDSLAATSPAIAADLSYEVWRRDPSRAASEEEGDEPAE